LLKGKAQRTVTGAITARLSAKIVRPERKDAGDKTLKAGKAIIAL